jgi:hypothetical protein
MTFHHPSIQRVFALSEREGLLSPNRLPPVEVGSGIDHDMYDRAVNEREGQWGVEDMLLGLGAVAVPCLSELPAHANGYGGSSKTSRDVPVNPKIEQYTSVPESIRGRICFVDDIAKAVCTEIDADWRHFYTYVEEVDTYSGEVYPVRKYIYDQKQIDAIRALEREALEYAISALRVEALDGVSRMRDYPSAKRLDKDGPDAHVNIARLLSQLENSQIDSEHKKRPKPWQYLLKAMIFDLKKRYDDRILPKDSSKRRWHHNSPDWYDYQSAGYERYL